MLVKLKEFLVILVLIGIPIECASDNLEPPGSSNQQSKVQWKIDELKVSLESFLSKLVFPIDSIGKIALKKLTTTTRAPPKPTALEFARRGKGQAMAFQTIWPRWNFTTRWTTARGTIKSSRGHH